MSGSSGADEHPMTRQARLAAIASSVAAVATLVAGCAASTPVELESADASTAAVDDQDGAPVIEAGVIDTAPVGPASSTSSPSTTAEPTSTTAPPGPSTILAEGATKELCATERARLRAAIDSYVAEFSTPPVSESDLLATMYLRTMSDVYDVRIDGSIRATDDTCAHSG
jgi:hypothetical protein